jgi:hypothetical protein
MRMLVSGCVRTRRHFPWTNVRHIYGDLAKNPYELTKDLDRVRRAERTVRGNRENRGSKCAVAGKFLQKPSVRSPVNRAILPNLHHGIKSISRIADLLPELHL